HPIWIINLFLYLVIAWWIFYRWRNQDPWRFLLFVFVLISPTLLYLASLLLFPGNAISMLPLITKPIITRTIGLSLFSSLCLHLSILRTRFSKASPTSWH